MPDLTVHPVEVCEQTIAVSANISGYYQQIHAQWGEDCTCPGFKFRRHCKHLVQLHASRCTWHGALDEIQGTPGICPRCGGPTKVVLWGA